MTKVLFVDDEELILRSLKRELRREEYDKYYANSGKEALEILKSETIDILVTDMRMPEMNGLDLLKIVKEEYPHIVKIVLSGYTHLPQVIVTINKGDIFRFITKPWNLDQDLKNAIRDGIEFSDNLKIEENKIKNLENRNKLFQKIMSRFDVRKEFIISDVVVLQTAFDVIIDEVNLIMSSKKYSKDLSEQKKEIGRLMFIEKELLLNFPFERENLNYEGLANIITSFIEKNFPNVVLEINYPSNESNMFLIIDLFLKIIMRDILERFNSVKLNDNIIFELSGDFEKTIENNNISFLGILIRMNTEEIVKYLNVERLIELFNNMFLEIIEIRYAHNENEMALQIKIYL